MLYVILIKSDCYLAEKRAKAKKSAKNNNNGNKIKQDVKKLPMYLLNSVSVLRFFFSAPILPTTSANIKYFEL